MKRWQVWLGIIVSLIFLFFALRGLDFTEIWNTIRYAQVVWILPAIPIYFFGLWLRSLRWKIFLQPVKQIKIRNLFPVAAIGYMGNNIYPARLGELVRAAVLKKDENISISSSLATIIIERIFDGIVMLGFILLNLSSIAMMIKEENIATAIDAVALWGSVVFILAFIIFLTSAIFPKPFLGILKWLNSKILPSKINDKVNNIIDQFFHGIQALSSASMTIFALLLTIAIWLVETVFYWMVMLAFPFHISFGALMLLNGFINLFTILPSSPGYIGTFDAPGIALLTALGIENQIAAGFTLLLHAALWLPVTVLGAIFFAREGLSWNETISEAEKGRDL